MDRIPWFVIGDQLEARADTTIHTGDLVTLFKYAGDHEGVVWAEPANVNVQGVAANNAAPGETVLVLRMSSFPVQADGPAVLGDGHFLIAGLQPLIDALDHLAASETVRELMAQQVPPEESALDRARRISRQDVRRKRHDQRRGG